MSILVVLITYFIWSFNIPIGKAVLNLSSPIFATAFRMILGGIIILGYLFLKKATFPKIKKVWILPIILVSFFTIYLTNVLEFWALQFLSIGMSSLLFSFNFLFVPIFSLLFLSEELTFKKCVGLCIGFLSAMFVLVTKQGNDFSMHSIRFFNLPEIVMIIGAISCAMGKVLSRLVICKHSCSPFAMNGYSMLIGGFFALIHSLIQEPWAPIPVKNPSQMNFYFYISLLIIISNLFGLNLYGIFLKKYSATVLSFFALLVPNICIFTAWLFFNEPITWSISLSTCGMALGIFLTYRVDKKKGYIQKSF